MTGERQPAWEGWWSQNLPGPPKGRFFVLRWPLFGVGFLLPILIPTVRAATSDGTPLGQAVLAIALISTYGVCYLVFPWLLFRRYALRVKLIFCAGMLALGWLVLLLGHHGTLYVLLYAMAVIAFGLPPAWALVLDGLSLAAIAALTLGGVGDYGSAGDLGALIGVTTTLFFVGRLVHTVRSLRAANDEIATLAVSAERARLARDLHDILGHSLTTITVKAGLARRILESAQDTERAAAEIREVEGLARSALTDVRATVSEYREVSLSAEIVGARAALRAAEIEADLPHAVDDVRPDLQQPFGYVLREAVTNVLRHSQAKHVTVRLGRTWLEIEDDGVGADGSPSGIGLRGLSERLAEIGGTLRTESKPGGGFVVHAEVRLALEVAS